MQVRNNVSPAHVRLECISLDPPVCGDPYIPFHPFGFYEKFENNTSLRVLRRLDCV